MSNKYCIFYIVRHGETEWNIKGLLQGHTDIPLNEIGERQAGALAKVFENIHFDAVYSSDLIRCKRTAQLIMLEKKLVIKTTELLREKFFGKFEGKEWKKNKEFIEYIAEMHRVSSKDRMEREWAIETNESVISRFLTFLRESAVFNPGKTILIVTHGGVMRISLIHLGWGTNKTLPPESIANTAYAKIESDGVDFFVKQTYGIDKRE